MPRGTRHEEAGILRLGRLGYELEVDGGGVWRLDLIRSCRRLIGERVIVEGTRSGFDLLDVTTIRGLADPARQSWLRSVIVRLWS